MESDTSLLNCLPPELLQQIIESLTIEELMRCRVVCRSWRALVDALTDDCWRRLCARDHAAVYRKARAKSSPDLTWRQLYKSLHLWIKLDSVDEYNWIEIIKYTKRRLLHGVCGLKTLNGQIILQENDKILYFDLEGEQVGVFDTEMQQVKYDETDNLIVYIGNHEDSIHRTVNKNSELRIIKKINGKPDLEGKIVIPDVENFIIVGNDVYYNRNKPDENNSKETTVYECRAKKNYTSTKLQTFTQEVVTYGSNNNRVNLLLGFRDIYVLENGNFVKEDPISTTNTLALARKYNLQPTEEFLLSISCDIILVIHSYCFYGKLTFLGCNDATVKVYDTEKFLEKPYLLFDEPLAEFDLYEWLRPVHKTWRNVVSVDVMEKKDGHVIVASIPKGAYAIELTHKFIEELSARSEKHETVDKTVDSEKDNRIEKLEIKKRRYK